MRDDQNNSQSLEMLSADQQQVAQEQSDFYVDPNSANQGMSPSESELFPSSSSNMGDNFSSGGGGFSNKRPIIALIVVFALGAMLFIFMPEKKTTKQIQKEEKAKIEVKKDETIKHQHQLLYLKILVVLKL
jgi:hypothetical protein